jgi:hypothetical protein
MKKTCLVLAMLIAGYGATCRADEDKPTPMERKADAKEVKKNDGKDYVETIDAASCAPAAEKKSGIVCAASAKCHCGRGAECCQRLWSWLTYCPLKKSSLCDCCHKCNNCHTPPPYLYFLDPYHACAPGSEFSACAAPGCVRP